MVFPSKILYLLCFISYRAMSSEPESPSFLDASVSTQETPSISKRKRGGIEEDGAAKHLKLIRDNHSCMMRILQKEKEKSWIEIFFESCGKRAKELPPDRQSLVQYQVTQIMFNAENYMNPPAVIPSSSPSLHQSDVSPLSLPSVSTQSAVPAPLQAALVPQNSLSSPVPPPQFILSQLPNSYDSSSSSSVDHSSSSPPVAPSPAPNSVKQETINMAFPE